MINKALPFPLQWPDSWPRSKDTIGSKFKSTLAAALKNVRSSLELFGKDSEKAVGEIVISSNVSLGNDKPSDPGVAVWFTWENQSICIAVDRYDKVQDNLQAIHHVIEARRTELRHGGLHLIRQTFAGLKALPPGPEKKPFWETLKLPAGSTKSEVEKAYKELAKQLHPDNTATGSEAAFLELKEAYNAALKTAQ